MEEGTYTSVYAKAPNRTYGQNCHPCYEWTRWPSILGDLSFVERCLLLPIICSLHTLLSWSGKNMTLILPWVQGPPFPSTGSVIGRNYHYNLFLKNSYLENLVFHVRTHSVTGRVLILSLKLGTTKCVSNSPEISPKQIYVALWAKAKTSNNVCPKAAFAPHSPVCAWPCILEENPVSSKPGLLL